MDQKEIKKLLARDSSAVENVIAALELLGNAFYEAAKSVRDFNKIAIMLSEKENQNGRKTMDIGINNDS